MTIIPQCFECKNFISSKRIVCKAFPDGIPDEIFFNEVSHTKPYKGDHGIQFEPIKESAK